MMNYDVISIQICVPLDAYQWDKLNSLDPFNFINKLEELGAYKVDWDGHFCSNIFFMVCGNLDDKTAIENIVKEIEKLLS